MVRTWPESPRDMRFEGLGRLDRPSPCPYHLRTVLDAFEIAHLQVWAPPLWERPAQGLNRTVASLSVA